jgi:hypothetical protein
MILTVYNTEIYVINTSGIVVNQVLSVLQVQLEEFEFYY